MTGEQPRAIIVKDHDNRQILKMMNRGWSLVSLLACMAALGHWCLRPTNSVTGGGGLGSVTSLNDLVPDLATPIRFFGSLFVSFVMGGSTTQHKQLVIAVASNLKDLDRRNAIRKTWKTLASAEDAKVFFVMAEHPCPIDPYWRLRETGCTSWQVSVPQNANDNMLVRPMRVVPSMVRPGVARDGIGFNVRFPVVIDHLAVAKRALSEYFASSGKQGNLTVDLMDAVTNDVLATVNFTRKDLTSIPGDDGFIYKPSTNHNCPRGFDGKVRIRNADMTTKGLSCNLHWIRPFGEDGPLVWTSVLQSGQALPFDPHACLLVSLVYRIPDLTELRQITNARATQNKCQESKNTNLAAKLVEESEDNDDDVFIVSDLVDTKENLALAVASFARWLTDPHTYHSSHTPLEFDFLLITEDTAFIALDQLIPKLRFPYSGGEMAAFRSRFKFFQPVKYFGSESVETKYVSQTYPPMPADAGSLLSRDLVHFLAAISQSHLFSGFSSSLSASLAIWLAPASPNYLDDASWSLNNNSCSGSSMAAGPFVAKGALTEVWTNYLKCGKICSCT